MDAFRAWYAAHPETTTLLSKCLWENENFIRLGLLLGKFLANLFRDSGQFEDVRRQLENLETHDAVEESVSDVDEPARPDS